MEYSITDCKNVIEYLEWKKLNSNDFLKNQLKSINIVYKFATVSSKIFFILSIIFWILNFVTDVNDDQLPHDFFFKCWNRMKKIRTHIESFSIFEFHTCIASSSTERDISLFIDEVLPQNTTRLP